MKIWTEFYVMQYDKLRAKVFELQDEIQRLKAGKFTPEELQNLCHNLDENDRDAFFAGCTKYQRDLFGCAAVDLNSKG